MDKLFIDITKIKELEKLYDIKQIKKINFDNYFQEYAKSKKTTDVEHAYNSILLKILNKSFSSPPCEGVYYFYGIGFQDGCDVEIFAKALFMLLYYRGNCDNQNTLYIAVDFQNKDYAKEFIRIFSIFYIKSDNNDSSSCMKDVQIAVCSNDEVNFVLAGENLTSAYETAKNFVYYNADASLEFVPLLKFLSDNEKDKTTEKSELLFPFDLYLQTTKDNREVSWFEKQMQDRLDTDLRTEKYGCKISDIKVRLGSKIYIDTFYEAELLFHNVGTIKRFAYLIAAEIVKDIEKAENDNKDDNPVANLLKTGGYLFLLGYENYSAVLMQEVLSLLTKYFEDRGKKDVVKAEWMIDTRSEDFPVLSFDKFTSNEKRDIIDAKNIQCVTILPLGSTMSTVYKLHDSFNRGLKRIKKEVKDEEENSTDNNDNRDMFLNNYCLVAIGKEFYNKKIGGVAGKYLELFESTDSTVWHAVKLKPARNIGDGVTVKYLLSALAKWEDPYPVQKNEKESTSAVDRSKHKSDKPLLKVDKTSTLLDAYFQTPLASKVAEYYKKNDKKKEKPYYLDKQKDDFKYRRVTNIAMFSPDGESGYIKYGHILRGDNHYQFYFDFEKISEKHRDDIIQWAREMKSLIDPEAYNIVISPLQITNAQFLKIILNETFGSNLHLLHINIQATGKENVRTKFEYIAQEFVNITRQRQKINFYYIDDAVCTGNGLARAWKFILTLCNQSGVDPQKLFPKDEKFAKVFLLLNRSSYETAQTWVKNPNEEWLGFINLCVPSYNTHMENNIVTCPGCRVHARYNKLRERCATNELVGYFAKHAKKHLPRNPKEYDLWLNEQILNSPSYFEWLRTWVWYHKRGNDALYKVIKGFYDTGNEEARDEWWKKQTIKAFLELSNENKNSKKEVMNKVHMIIAKDNFLRLETMDDAYRKLLYNDNLQKVYNDCINDSEFEKCRFEKYKNYLREKIVGLLAECFTGVEKARSNKKRKKTNKTPAIEENKLKEEIYNATFRFISYIKVISRDYLAKNYFIREGMYNVLNEIFHFMILNKGYNERLKNFIKPYLGKRNWHRIFYNIANINNALQYRIFKTITHRLALMHSEEMFQSDIIVRTNEVFEAMVNSNARSVESKIFLALPDEDDMKTSYFASVKTATMEDDNDAICLTLWNQTKKLGDQKTGKN